MSPLPSSDISRTTEVNLNIFLPPSPSDGTKFLSGGVLGLWNDPMQYFRILSKYSFH